MSKLDSAIAATLPFSVASVAWVAELGYNAGVTDGTTLNWAGIPIPATVAYHIWLSTAAGLSVFAAYRLAQKT